MSINVGQYGITSTAKDTSLCVSKENDGSLFFIDLNVLSNNTDFQVIWTLNDSSWTNNKIADSIRIDKSGSLIYTIENSKECSISDTIWINLSENPEISVAEDNILINKPENVMLTVFGSTDLTYMWSPSDILDDPSSQKPVAYVDSTTIFKIVATNPSGCLSEKQILVSLEFSECTEDVIFIPTAFSPNGDNINDVFEVKSEAIKEFDLRIYNRWGILVFESADLGKVWNGTYEDKSLNTDVFGYIINVQCYSGDIFTKKGNITLVK
jgi:gliding motility-associated-like protein